MLKDLFQQAIASKRREINVGHLLFQRRAEPAAKPRLFTLEQWAAKRHAELAASGALTEQQRSMTPLHVAQAAGAFIIAGSRIP